jgi:hypothetical protein
MTFAGKLFVLFNVGLSLFWAIAAFALYTNSIDWAPDMSKGADKAGGLIKELTAEIDREKRMQYPVENAWREARSALLEREDRRRQDRDFYAKEIAYNRDKAAPARMVKLAGGAPELDKRTNRPVMVEATDRAGKPLQSLTFYRGELETRQKDNAAILDDLKRAIYEDQGYTDLLVDGADKAFADEIEKENKEARARKPANEAAAEVMKRVKADHGLTISFFPPLDFTRKGLRTRIVEERDKYEGLDEERRVAHSLSVNTAVESELIQKRLEQLRERVKELDTYIKKRKLDVELTRR